MLLEEQVNNFGDFNVTMPQFLNCLSLLRLKLPSFFFPSLSSLFLKLAKHLLDFQREGLRANFFAF